jgi:hypothetical protein
VIANGILYHFTVSNAVDTTLTEMMTGALALFDTSCRYSSTEYAGYLIISDALPPVAGAHTPYKWDGANDITKLIQSGTEYKFAYLENWQNRIWGAWSDEASVGQFSVRFTDANAALASLTFPAANQLYIPGSDIISGIKKLNESCIVYGTESINEIVYYPSSSLRPFGITEVLHKPGPPFISASLVGTPNAHYFYARDYGFVEYSGGTNYEIISDDIEDLVAAIYDGFDFVIHGVYLPPDQIVWAIPSGAASTLDTFLAFDIQKRTWTRWNPTVSPKALGCFRTIKLGATDNYQRSFNLVMGGTDTPVYAYNNALDADAGSNMDGYRVEPIMDFGDQYQNKFLSEIRFGIVQGGDYSLDVSWRGGDTVKEVKAASWTALPSLSLNSPGTPAIFPGQTARLHQIKWGTNLKDERFEVNHIDLMWTPAGI